MRALETNERGMVEITPVDYTDLLACRGALKMVNGDIPDTLRKIPYAYTTWNWLHSLGIDFAPKQAQQLISYCLAAAQRDIATNEWISEGMPIMIEENGITKKHPLLLTIKELNGQISRLSADIGLTEKQAKERPKNTGGEFNFD